MKLTLVLALIFASIPISASAIPVELAGHSGLLGYPTEETRGQAERLCRSMNEEAANSLQFPIPPMGVSTCEAEFLNRFPTKAQCEKFRDEGPLMELKKNRAKDNLELVKGAWRTYCRKHQLCFSIGETRFEDFASQHHCLEEVEGWSLEGDFQGAVAVAENPTCLPCSPPTKKNVSPAY